MLPGSGRLNWAVLHTLHLPPRFARLAAAAAAVAAFYWVYQVQIRLSVVRKSPEQVARNTGSGHSYKSRQSLGPGGKDDSDSSEQEDTSEDNSIEEKDSFDDCSQLFGTSVDRSSREENISDNHSEATTASDPECEKVAVRPEESLVDWIDRQLREAEERRRDTQLSNVK